MFVDNNHEIGCQHRPRPKVLSGSRLLCNASDPENIVREADAAYSAERICFICGGGDSDEDLVGSAPLCDWVHLGCLKQPCIWD